MAESFVMDHGHGHQRCERGFNRPYDMDTSRLLDLGIRHHIQRSLVSKQALRNGATNKYRHNA